MCTLVLYRLLISLIYITHYGIILNMSRKLAAVKSKIQIAHLDQFSFNTSLNSPETLPNFSLIQAQETMRILGKQLRLFVDVVADTHLEVIYTCINIANWGYRG